MHAGIAAPAEGGHGLEIPLEPGWPQRAQRGNAARWAVDRGYVSEGKSGQDLLSVPWEDWDALAEGPASADPEDEDRWVFEHEALAQLLALVREELRIEPTGHVGGSSLRVRVLVNGRELILSGSNERYLRFVGGTEALLSPLAWRVAQRAREFASAETHSRAEQLALIAQLQAAQALSARFSAIRERLSIALDEHFESFEIARPPGFSVKWADDGKSRVSLQLFVKGSEQPLPLESFDEQGIIDLGGRSAVLLSPGARAVATRARDHQRSRKERIPPAALRSPFALLGDDVDTSDLDFSDYSHRVIGFEPARRETERIAYTAGTSWYEDDGAGTTRFLVRATTPTGAAIQLAVEGAEEALQVAQRAETAAAHPGTSIEVQGVQVLPTPTLASELRELVRLAYPLPEAPSDSPAGKAAPKPYRVRPVVEEVAQLSDSARIAAWNIEGEVPWHELDTVLQPGVTLKAHQRTGIAWLWHRYGTGRPGALLADDMGLGKTLQIACFVALAKLLPRGSTEPRPTLVVAPVILIANWAEELKRFFSGKRFPGRVLQLHDSVLRSLKDRQGSLDRERIQEHDIVITSYETLARYAPSLLGITWDLAVLDEGHRIKNRGTSWSMAARGLSGLDDPERPRKFDFAICATGTPVENHVMDLWALYDFLSPGSPFGTYDQFCGDYRDRPDAAQALASRLDVGSLESSLLRRTKDEVLPDELPGKSYRSVPVAMTDFQRAQEQVLTSRARSGSGSFFGVLQSLQKLYQHPWLLDESAPAKRGDANEAIAASPKLAETLRLLEHIRSLGEKALVFTLWTEMQYLLKDVIESRMGLSQVRIINGDPKNRARALEFIEEFSDAEGFNVLVLSPLAAGMGLNIVAANHVIHYGRWWNPAKEDQATDRAYRIGQTRHVTVYYPVLHHPGQPDLGFDVKLDSLVGRKRAMARALLEPVDGDDVTEHELHSAGVAER